MHRPRKFHYPLLVALPLCLLGCAAPAHHVTQRAEFTTYAKPQSAGLTDQEKEMADTLCLFGMPQRDPKWRHGPTTIIVRPGYVLEHSNVDKVPLWVCEHVKAEHIVRSADRKECQFDPDPKLNAGQRSELADYRGSGYDRGHNAPAGDFAYDQDRMCDSFYLSNIAPQVGKEFNQHIWRVLEDRARRCVKDDGEAYITTGVFMYDENEDDPQKADGMINHETIGDDGVAVPTHFFKIVVGKDSSNQWKAMAFVMENKKYPIKKDSEYDFHAYIKSIDWLEERTGLNFMPDLDSNQPALEQALERNPGAMWPCVEAN